MKCTAVCLVVLALHVSLCDAQWVPGVQPNIPKWTLPSKNPQVPQTPQQTKQTFDKPLNWKYPVPPQPEVLPLVPFEQRSPVPAATVAVQCKEKIARVEVKRDMFGIGQLINPADLFLGNCAPVAQDPVAKVLIFEVALQDCQSTLTMKENSLIYSFTLNYVPNPLGTAPVVRTTQAAVIVECHYPRKHNVSSLPLDPLWIPFSAVKVADEFLYFTLKLMMDDWQNERPSYQYFLGDTINIQATVKQFFHVPLRVYVDTCVATLSADATSTPSYAFIENFGCLVDARITGSVSKYMPRSADNKLQFQLEAFRFQGAASGMLYITCHLKATSAKASIDSTHRACSYINGWKEASGADSACGSCESRSFGTPGNVPSLVLPASPPIGGGSPGAGGSGGSTGAGGSGGSPGAGGTKEFPKRWRRDVSESEVFEWEGDVTLGPIPIGEKVVT
ncbi:zona pellucida sperm-binding protein 3-like [Etheostoma cragini]|uniref:zona pellucida sperm-binding protein 3-like n=1 Tax=Etheostoma cragini TaxID=417921 RepID=UPI00155E8ACF|nr:zona pellucida sperm-binding protein 3-like [Etheostoma cragini]